MTVKVYNGLQERNSDVCRHCGHLHFDRKCNAKSAKCNRCYRIGHFARVCAHPIIRLKTGISKQRDTERMTAFINRKTAENVLPFYNTDIDFILSIQTNASFPRVSAVLSHQENLRKLNKRLVKEVCELRKQEDTFQQLIKGSIDAVALLQNNNNILEHRFQAGQKVLQQTVSSMSAAKLALKHEKEKNQKMETKLDNMSKEFDTLDGVRKVCEEVNSMMSEENKVKFDESISDSLKLQCEFLIGTLSCKKTELKDDTMIISRQKDKIRAIKNENQTYHTKLQAAFDEIRNLQDENDKLTQDLENMKSKCKCKNFKYQNSYSGYQYRGQNTRAFHHRRY